MCKTTDGTKLFVRFLREKGIKYIFTEEILRNAYRKKYERKQFSRFLSDEVDGNLLKYLNSLFSRGFYNIIDASFSWVNTKNGYNFWAKMEWEWEWDYIHK